MQSDVNLLFATVATVSAAIVAIVGGLVTASLLQMEGERKALAMRADDRRREVKILEQERNEATREADRIRTSFLFREKIGEIIRFDSQPTPEVARRRLNAEFIPADIFSPLWQRLTEEIDRERNFVVARLDLNDSSDTSFDQWYRAFRGDSGSHSEWLTRRIYQHLTDGRFEPDDSEMRDEERRQIEQCEVRASEANRRLAAVQVELDYVLPQLQRTPSLATGSTRYVKFGVLILIFFSATGIVYPLALMPLEHDRYTELHKISVLGAFVVDLVLLFTYIGFLFRDIHRRA